jgi:hypothetical protein
MTFARSGNISQQFSRLVWGDPVGELRLCQDSLELSNSAGETTSSWPPPSQAGSSAPLFVAVDVHPLLDLNERRRDRRAETAAARWARAGPTASRRVSVVLETS